jgi:hypothetical protein
MGIKSSARSSFTNKYAFGFSAEGIFVYTLSWTPGIDVAELDKHPHRK